MGPKNSTAKPFATFAIPIAEGTIKVGDIITMAGMRVTKKGKLKKIKYSWHKETPFIVGAIIK